MTSSGTPGRFRLRSGVPIGSCCWMSVATALCLLIFGASLVCAAEVRGRVVWVHDGDTLQVEGVGKVRLLGLDTPESDASARDAAYRRAGIAPRRLRQTAKAATDFTIRAAKGQVVTLSFDRERSDRHGRVLAYVTLPDGRMLNRELLKAGLAFVYRRFDFRLKDDFLHVEAEARAEGRGVWGKP